MSIMIVEMNFSETMHASIHLRVITFWKKNHNINNNKKNVANETMKSVNFIEGVKLLPERNDDAPWCVYLSIAGRTPLTFPYIIIIFMTIRQFINAQHQNFGHSFTSCTMKRKKWIEQLVRPQLIV